MVLFIFRFSWISRSAFSTRPGIYMVIKPCFGFTWKLHVGCKISWFQQEMQTICGTETGWKILGRAGKGGANLFYVRGRNYKGCRGLNCNGANSPQNVKLRGERYVGNSGFKTSEIVILSTEFWPPFFVSQHRWLIRCEYQRTGWSNSCCPQLDAERNTTDEWNINVFT